MKGQLSLLLRVHNLNQAGYTRDSDPLTDEYLIWCRQAMFPDINVTGPFEEDGYVRPLGMKNCTLKLSQPYLGSSCSSTIVPFYVQS